MVTFCNYTISDFLNKKEKMSFTKILTVFDFIIFRTVFHAIVPSSTITDAQKMYINP